LFNRREYFYQEKKRTLQKVELILSENDPERIMLGRKHLVYCNTNETKPDYQEALHL